MAIIFNGTVDGDGAPMSPDTLLPQARAEYDKELETYQAMGVKDVPVIYNPVIHNMSAHIAFDPRDPKATIARFSEDSRRWTIEDVKAMQMPDAELATKTRYPDPVIRAAFNAMARKAGISAVPVLIVLKLDETAFEGGYSGVTQGGMPYVALQPDISEDVAHGILAHELGHIHKLLDPQTPGGPAGSMMREHNDESRALARQSELEADRFAVTLGEEKGLLRDLAAHGANAGDRDHPVPAARLAALEAAVQAYHAAHPVSSTPIQHSPTSEPPATPTAGNKPVAPTTRGPGG